MERRAINPEAGEWADHDVAYADGVVVEMSGAKRVFVSGVVAAGPTIEAQTRSVLERIEEMLADYGGGMEDVVRVRVYLKEDELNEAALETVHEVRSEFFSADHLPASTLVEVGNLVSDEFRIEIDADAIVPHDGWEVE